MARELLKVEKNTLLIADSIGGGRVEITYRMPSTRERIAYQRACVLRLEGKGPEYDPSMAREAFGIAIITGFREGDFVADGVNISTDPAAKNYREDWKDLLLQQAPDIVAAVGLTVFEGVVVIGGSGIGRAVEAEIKTSDVPPPVAGEGGELPLANS